MTPSVSRLDQVYRSIVLQKFFSRGWGCPDNLKKLFEFRKIIGNRETCLKLVDPDYHISIDKIHLDESGEFKLVDGHFKSPFAVHCPGLLPKIAETAYFQLVLPVEWKGPDRPVCVQMAGTGDHFFWRRRNFIAKPLIKDHGIASLILENPYYGLRKPVDQFRSSLLNVSDIFVMGGSLILEGVAILQWLEKEGYGPNLMHGISMGGHMASLAASTWGKPIPLIPCLSWSTASGVFTQGVMSGAIDWKSLEYQFLTNKVYNDEFYKMVWSDTDEAYQAGKDFVSQYKPIASIIDDPAKNIVPDKKYKEKNSPFHGLTTFLRDRGLLKILPTINSPELIASPDVVKVADYSGSVIGNSKFKVQKEAIQFMRGVMDEFTHLKNFAKPVDPELIIVVAAKNDAYVPRDGFTPLNDIWPGCEVRFIDSGHVSAYVLHQGLFRKTIAEALDRYRNKYHSDGTLKNPNVHKKIISGTNKVVEVLGFQNSQIPPQSGDSHIL